MKFNNHCDLDLEQSNAAFAQTLWLMIMYHQTKLGCKRISSSEDTAETMLFHITPHCDYDLEDTKTTSLHYTLVHDTASS